MYHGPRGQQTQGLELWTFDVGTLNRKTLKTSEKLKDSERNARKDGNMNAAEIAELLRANPMLDPSEIDEFLTTFAR